MIKEGRPSSARVKNYCNQRYSRCCTGGRSRSGRFDACLWLCTIISAVINMTSNDIDIVEAADAIGIPCIVIDEDFDWSTLPRFSDLFPQSKGE